MALKIDTKFKGKVTCAFKNDMRNLANMLMLNNRIRNFTKIFTHV